MFSLVQEIDATSVIDYIAFTKEINNTAHKDRKKSDMNTNHKLVKANIIEKIYKQRMKLLIIKNIQTGRK